jgi:argininosuccinate lyase
MLGFDGLVENSLDGVGGRDFALESLAVCSIIASNLSRVAQDWILYSSGDVGLLELSPEYSSTSSIMPQKKNADPLELIRAKSAKVASNFNSVAVLLHGLTSGYNLDYQEITPIIWQSIAELKSSLKILVGLVPGIKVNEQIAKRGYLEFTSATEIANILTLEEGMSFRAAHQSVGALVKSAISQGKTMREMGRADWQRALGYRISGRTFRMMLRTLNLKSQLRVYRTDGSPTPNQTKHLIAVASGRCRQLARKNQRARAKCETSMRLLRRTTLAIQPSE